MYLTAVNLKESLVEWQYYYNWERSHNGKAPMECYFELTEQTVYSNVIHANYHPGEEDIQEQNYKLKLGLRKLRGAYESHI